MPSKATTEVHPNMMMRLMSVLSERFNLAQRAGLQYGGLRDLYKVFGYKRELMFEDYYNKYERQDIAARIIDAPAAALWRDPPRIFVDGVDSFESAWNAHADRYRIWSYIERLDKLAGLGQYAALFVGLPGDVSTQAPSTDEIMYMKPLGQSACRVSRLVEDPASERFGLPELYEVRLGQLVFDMERPDRPAPSTRTIHVHWTRMLHVVERPLESQVYGIPRLKPVYNLLDDLMKVVGGSAETYWITGNRGIQADVDKEMDFTAEDAEALADSLDDYIHQLRRVIRTRGVKINTLGSDVPDPRGVFEVLMSLIAGSTGIPQRILMGAEAGQLASEQDRANWAERIRERQESFGESCVLVPYIKQMQAIGILPDTGDSALQFEWGDPFHMSPLEQAQMFAQQSRAVGQLSRQWQYGAPILTQEESREMIGYPREGGPEMKFTPLGSDLPEPEDDEEKKPGEPSAVPGAGPNAKIRGPSDL